MLHIGVLKTLKDAGREVNRSTLGQSLSPTVKDSAESDKKKP